jgi:hypothetical protein
VKEIIKYEIDENGEHATLTTMASGDTTMNLIAKLILNMARMTKGKLSVNFLLKTLEAEYIPKMIVEMKDDKVVHEEVIYPE